jgi:hypothetical protein
MNHVGRDVQPWAHECETIDSIKHNAQIFKNQYLRLRKNMEKHKTTNQMTPKNSEAQAFVWVSFIFVECEN